MGALMVVLLAAAPAAAAVQGLERLPGFRRGGCPSVFFSRALVAPPQLTRKKVTATKWLQDFKAQSSGQSLLLRQVVDNSHPRMTAHWWGFYYGRTLGDCWFFSPAAAEEHGPLAPYTVEDLDTRVGDTVVFHTRGSMHRPGGYGWMNRTDLLFRWHKDGLHLDSAIRLYSFSYEERGDRIVVSVSVHRMKEVGGQRRLEVREWKEVPESVLKKCGYQDPLVSELDEADFNRTLDRAATCIAEAPGAATCEVVAQVPDRYGRICP